MKNPSERREREKVKKRDNKNAPVELSSKRPRDPARVTLENSVPKQRNLDPRFIGNTGHFDMKTYRKRYAFLDDLVSEEAQKLRKAAEELGGKGSKRRRPPTARDLEARDALLAEARRIDAQLSQQRRRDEEARVEAQWKKEERERVRNGKRPYFLKDSARKELVALADFERLGKGKGAVGKVVEKRRKRIAAKERRYIPSGRVDKG